MASLVAPVTLPHLGTLQSRVVMSAMTRDFAGPGHTATPAMAEYYARRAAHGVGLILTEGTIVDPSGDGYRSVPRLHTVDQARSWREVTRRVHDHGAAIFSQLWHCGRISHPDFLAGAAPVSSTDAPASGINRQNGKPYGVPRRLDAAEMQRIYAMFARAASLALEAGFDGVELHCGHGYLPDEFLDGRINDRQDQYGGSVENRCRFTLELVETVIRACGADRLIVRISPARHMDVPYEWSDLEAMVAHLVPALADAGLRILDVSCARADYFATSGRVIRLVRPRWPHVLIGGASLSMAQAEDEIARGLLDLVTYGRWLIANPDLVERMRSGDALRPFEMIMLGRLD